MGRLLQFFTDDLQVLIYFYKKKKNKKNSGVISFINRWLNDFSGIRVFLTNLHVFASKFL